MKWTALFLSLFVAAMVTTTAYAGADDKKWVGQCVKDNSDAKASTEVVVKYCTCMNNKMDENETKTITQWEKSHQTEQKACSKEAGWE